MTAEQFRKLALSFDGAVEFAHQGHPDFRVRGKVFATLGYPDDAHGMIKLEPELQAELMQEEPEVYFAAAGAWGRRGCTLVRLKKAKLPSVCAVMRTAARNLGQQA